MQANTNLNGTSLNSKNKAITIYIDGIPFDALEDETILQVCRRNKIEIPTLCYDPRLNPNGSCLLCVVEVEGFNKLALACVTKVKNGMKVVTNNELIFTTRKRTLELLLSNHFADCRGNCYEKCPANVDVQGYIALASVGKYEEALQLIRKNNPLPMVCGRVCVRYCEANCRRKDIDSSVAVNFIKRYIADLMTDKLPKETQSPSTGKKVAIIGSGPAGLSAAYYLAKLGHSVTIYEAQPKLGGMLRYGIPEYRLPSKVLDKEIEIILSLGIEVKTETVLGKNLKISDLYREYDAIFLAIGAWKAKKMQIENENAIGVFDGIEFLKRVKEEQNFKITGEVLVVGGGNTAIDAARTALRCGATKVKIVYRRTKEEMPADEIEISDALAEGVEIMYLTAPIKVLTENNRVTGLLCQKMKLGEPDDSGRAKPIPIPNSEFVIPASVIIAAIGQDVELNCLNDENIKLELTKWKTIKVDEHSFATNIPKIFAGGDAVTAPKAAIDAIAAGRKAAYVINHFLHSNQIINYPQEFISKKTNLASIPKSYFETLQKIERVKPTYLPVSERINSFNEVDKGIDEKNLYQEVSRCLSCGCTDIYKCKLKDYASLYNACQKNFNGRIRIYDVDNRHPYISIDKNKCILCGKCVYLCKDIIDASALGFINRGFETYISTAYNDALNHTTCISCGNCIDICPTGALSFKILGYKPSAWETKRRSSICWFCGLGCELDLEVYNDRIWWVTGKWNNELQIHDFTCKYGRFGYNLFYSLNSKILNPKLKVGGISNKTDILNNSSSSYPKYNQNLDLENAIKLIYCKFQEISNKYGSDKILFLVSPYCTNEEIFLIKKISKEFKQSSVTSLTHIKNFVLESMIYKTNKHEICSTATINDILDADIILTPNTSFTSSHPVLKFLINLNINKKGNFIKLPNSISRLTLYSISRIKPEITNLINQTLNHISKVNNHKKIVFIISLDGTDDIVSYINYIVFKNIADYINNTNSKVAKILLLRKHVNSQGVFSILCKLDKIEEALNQEKIFKNLLNGHYKALFSLGEDIFSNKSIYRNLIHNLEFSVAMDCLENETTRNADIVLPSSSYLEKFGTIISTDNRIKKLEAIFEFNNTEMPNKSKLYSWHILAKLYEHISGNQSASFEDLQNEVLEKLISLYKSSNKSMVYSDQNSNFGFESQSSQIYTTKYTTTFDNLHNLVIRDIENITEIVKELNNNNLILFSDETNTQDNIQNITPTNYTSNQIKNLISNLETNYDFSTTINDLKAELDKILAS